MSMSWDTYNSMQEAAAWGDFQTKIEKAIKAQDQGRNQSCFPLCSFGVKDADLEPSGCTGIKALSKVTDDVVTVQVGGHKTFSPPEDASRTDEAQELINGCGYSGEWTGEDWSIPFSQDIEVPYEWTDEKTDEENYAVIAALIIKKAKEACDEFSKDMAELTVEMGKLDQ